MRFTFVTLVLLAGSFVACREPAPATPSDERDGTPPAADRTCEQGGKIHAEGESFPSLDGCNTCSCHEGQIACTEKACLDPENPPPSEAGEAKQCGARAGNSCSEKEFCAYEPGGLCGQADAQATCQPRPEMCTQQYDPVCGCDGKTYGNACSAQSAGQGIMSRGECKAR